MATEQSKMGTRRRDQAMAVVCLLFEARAELVVRSPCEIVSENPRNETSVTTKNLSFIDSSREIRKVNVAYDRTVASDFVLQFGSQARRYGLERVVVQVSI